MQIVLMRYFVDIGRLYNRLLVPARKEGNLTQAEMDILLFLANNPEYDTASDIVAVRRLAKSNVSVGVRSLEAKGLLRRCPDKKDRRVEHLSVTPAAGPLVERGREGQQEFGALLLKGFSPEERETLVELMDRIQQNVSLALDELL